jgi:methylenetetrahydrofolate dehydrogenase (NAD+)
MFDWSRFHRYQEFTKRPRTEEASAKYHPRHVVHSCTMSLQECLTISDVVVSAVPNAAYKVSTEWLKDGCICINVAADKNFEKDVRDKVRFKSFQPVQRAWIHSPT